MTFKYRKRNLPQIEISERTYFITFNTLRRRILKPEERDIVFNSILFHTGKKYILISSVIMPDHVYLILSPFKKDVDFYSLQEILHSIKSYSSLQINKINNQKGNIWQAENYDNVIRDEIDLYRKLTYVLNNPVKKQLVENIEEYRWIYVKNFIERNLE